MDARTRRFLTAIDDFLEGPGQLPDALVQNVQDLKEMVEAPRYSEESPGEKEAREVAEENMPKEVVDDLYSEDNDISEDNVGVLD